MKASAIALLIGLLFAVACKTANTQPGITICPWCRYITEPYWQDQYSDKSGTYVITYWRCVSIYCAWTGSTTNKISN